MRIGTFKSLAITAAILLGAAASACNSADTANSSTDSEESKSDDEQGTDEPAWVNSMYLTCAWDSVESRSTVGVACKPLSKDAAFDPTAAGIRANTWRVIGSDGNSVSATKKDNADGTTFILNARDVASLSAEAKLSDGAFTKALSVRFEDLLEGLQKGGKLAACFNSEIGVGDCFAALGIKPPNGDRTVGKPIFPPEESACNNPGSLPTGVPCSVTSDGMIGDYDQAREWFMEGNDLVAANGDVRSADFCDQNGIKASTPKGSTSRKARWFPFWKVGARPCFMPFVPEGSPAPWTGKHIVYNNDDTANGEPRCLFAIIAEPTIFGGKLHRMHIFKNPRVFSDAASGNDLTRAALESFAEHFSCRE